MHVTIEHKTVEVPVSRQKSVFNILKSAPQTDTHYELHLYVRLNEEEKAICNEYDLAEKILFSQRYHIGENQLRETPEYATTVGGDWNYHIGTIIRPEGVFISFPTFIDAKNFEHQLKTVHLPKLKEYIEHTAKLMGDTNSSFEL